MWDKMDELLDGKHRYKTRLVWLCYLGINMAIMAEYCYRVTPQWH
jgi:hypothetical protein